MTKYKLLELGGEKKRIFLLNDLITIYYAVFLLQSYSIHTRKPTPYSCRESLKTLKIPSSVFQKPESARIGYASHSLIIRDIKTLFEGKSKRDRVFGGESKPLPRLIQTGFEGDQTTLPLASEMGVKISLKGSGSDGLRGMGLKSGWRRKSPKNAVWMGVGSIRGWRNVYAICICYKGLGDNCTAVKSS